MTGRRLALVLLLGALPSFVAVAWVDYEFRRIPVTQKAEAEMRSMVARCPVIKPIYADAMADGGAVVGTLMRVERAFDATCGNH